MNIIKKYDFGSFEPWSGARDRWEIVAAAGKLDELEEYVEDMTDGGEIDETELNDLIWFEFHGICQHIWNRSEEWIIQHEKQIRAGEDPDEIGEAEAAQ